MIDTINPMNFDITKNLHGHVRVETRDRWTGRVVDSQEKDNLVTDALQSMLMACAWTDKGSSTSMGALFSPIYSKALGTVFCFNNTLTASASNAFFPATAKLVAFAGQGANSTDANQGSYNEQESTYTSNGFTSVWDFATSQANGTIASISRGSYYFGTNPACIGDVSGESYTGSGAVSGVAFLGYDEANHYLYFGLNSEQTINGVTYPTNTIYRVKQNFSSIGLTSFMPPAERMTAVKQLSSSDGTVYATYFIYDKYDNNFVYITGNTIHLIAMDGTHTTKTLSGAGSSDRFNVTENYYWRAYNGTIYRISKSNTSDVTTYSTGGGSVLAAAENDIIFEESDQDGPIYLLYPDGTFVQIAAAGGAWYRSWSLRQVAQFLAPGTSYVTYLSMLCPNSSYLGTIANLDSPVTKTSSQTMKITYTLTEA